MVSLFVQVSAILRETSEGTSYLTVRWAFRPYAHFGRTICTSVSRRASTRVSSSPLSPIWPDVAAQVALYRASRIVPATKLRVAPALQSFLPCQWMDLRVAPILACLSLALKQIAKLPRLSASRLAADEGSGCPFHSIVWLYRRRIFESPRISRPSAVLSVTPQVALARPCSSLCR